MSSKSREKRMEDDPQQPTPACGAGLRACDPWWARAIVGLALGCAAACTGPGLEPPEGGRGQSPGGAGGGGANGSAGSGGSAGTGSPSAGAGALAGTGGGGQGGQGGQSGQGGSEPTDEEDASVDDGGGATHDSRELVGPSYMGSVSNSAACSRSYPTRGHEPVSEGRKHPLFLYFVGTAFIPGTPSASYDSPAALAVTEAMARRGFVALSVQYDNDALAWLSDHVGQLACLFGADKPASLIQAACALPNVDCELGIATWGHSQGAYVAHKAHNLEPRVRAAWTTGYGGDAGSTLPHDRLRVVNGENDAADNGTAAKLMMITGLTPAECPLPDRCLREDGSGWIIVRKSALAMPETSSADHCWFDRPSCGASMIALEPSWVDPASDEPFALEPNADWLAATARR